LREFYQIDVDLVGLPEGEADLEVICLASSILKGFDIGEDAFVIRVNSRALLNAACASAGLSPEATRTYLRLLDRQAKMTPEDFRTAREAITHEDPLTHLNRSAMESFIETLRTRGVTNAVFDPTVTRGFDYYTGLVFEVFDTNPVNPRSLFGGGRYDGLVELYGGEPIPAVGFAIGDVTLADFLETHDALPPLQGYLPELYLGTPSPADSPAAQLVATRLRSYGCRIVINISSRSLGDQIKEAVKRGIPHFAAYGSDEASRGTLKIKTLSTGHEEEVRIDDVPGWLTNHPL
jgi:histidyl-tRNA synthetase